MVTVTLPIRLPSLANERRWWVIMRLKKTQKEETWYALRDVTVPPLPLVITITRHGPKTLDDDNLAAACKYVRDEIARKVGVDDGSPLYTWVYKQATGRYSVTVEIAARGTGEGQVSGR